MRRLFGGGVVEAHRPLYTGREASRNSEIADRREKQGRSGPLTFVTVQHSITQDGETAVVDRQDIVYLPDRTGPSSPKPPPTGPAPASMPPPTETGPDRDVWVTGGWQPEPPTTRTLFQFSALTYNAHRIHYDRDYAREVEGYPDLVVHGPLQALYLAEAARRRCHDEGRPAPASCRYRLPAPLFLGDPVHVAIAPTEQGIRAEIRTDDRVTATAAFE
jgi:3-methylfumaryl-CoA hydratase